MTSTKKEKYKRASYDTTKNRGNYLAKIFMVQGHSKYNPLKINYRSADPKTVRNIKRETINQRCLSSY